MFKLSIKFNGEEDSFKFKSYLEALIGYNFLRMILEETGVDYEIAGNFHVRGDKDVYSQRNTMGY